MGDFVEELRLDLFKGKRSLKWWYNKYVLPKIPKLRYSNFIRKVNYPDEMTPELKKLVEDYLGNI